jgi:hypothetical protein
LFDGLVADQGLLLQPCVFLIYLQLVSTSLVAIAAVSGVLNAALIKD